MAIPRDRHCEMDPRPSEVSWTIEWQRRRWHHLELATRACRADGYSIVDGTVVDYGYVWRRLTELSGMLVMVDLLNDLRGRCYAGFCRAHMPAPDVPDDSSGDLLYDVGPAERELAMHGTVVEVTGARVFRSTVGGTIDRLRLESEDEHLFRTAPQ